MVEWNDPYAEDEVRGNSGFTVVAGQSGYAFE